MTDVIAGIFYIISASEICLIFSGVSIVVVLFFLGKDRALAAGSEISECCSCQKHVSDKCAPMLPRNAFISQPISIHATLGVI